ncbi:MAG: iron ABC transporter permease [Flavobacteriales bacterium]|nr:iron ABC transporter permease [Flavobacteriales bacterium]
MFSRKSVIIISLAAFVILLFMLELVFGSVDIPASAVIKILAGEIHSNQSWNTIILLSRLPRTCAAVLAGSSLALAGLLMQTLFRNPLAGPSVLGISSGSSLAVALLVMGTGGMMAGVSSDISIAIAAIVGAMVVLFIISIVAERLNDNVALLIFGIMLGYVVGAIENVLQFNASKESLRAFVMWGMGSFAEVTQRNEVFIIVFTLLFCGIVIGLFLPRLNLLLMGEDYAKSMGVNTKRTRLIIIIVTGILTGVVTAFCGPVALIGLVVPHIVRMMLRTSNHKKMFLPLVLCGGCAGLLCDLVSRTPWTTGGLPLNAVTSMLGAPVVIYIILRGRNSKAII